MNITRKILYNLFKDIAEKHLQIHSFFWGDVPDAFGRQDIIFPLMIVTPNSVSMNLGEVSHSYTVTILDRLIDGDTNKVDVDSDCFQYYRDVVAQLDRLNQVDFGIEFPMTPEPVQDVSPHLCYGFQGEMLINVDENYDQCAVPSEPISFDPTLVCLPASYVVKYTNDVIIEQGTIPSGGSVVVIVPDAQDATWELRDTDGVLIDSGSIPSGGSATIVAPNGVVDVRDTDGNTLYSVSVVSGGSAIQVVGDSSIEVRNSLNVVVDSGVVKAQGSGVFNAPDATFTINGDASFSPIPSGGAENVLVENTNGTPVGAFDGNSNSWVIPDQTIEVNTVNEGAIPSVGTIEIDITDGTNPVTPNDVTIVGRKVTVEVPSGGAVMNVDFSADKVTADVGEVITFTDLTDNSPTHWSWRFDSEGQSIVQNPTFSFSTTGFKNITLLAGKVGAGGVEIKNSYIEILAALLLDAFPNAAAAYSLRKLRAAYTGSAIRVRRSTDNTEQDIGFNGSNGLDTTALLAFVGAGNGFVATWYDQSGNGRDVIQTSSANQPQIVSSGSVIAENGKPSVQFNGTSNVLTASTASNWNFLHQAGIYFNFGVAKAGDNVDPNNIYAIWGNTSTVAQNGSYLAYDDRVSSSRNNALFQVIGASNNNPVVLNVVNNYQSANIQFMHTLKADPNNATASERSAIATNGRAFNKNNTASFTASTNAATRPLSIGAIPDASNVLIFFMKGAIQEQIFYASDQSFNQTAIESNINSFYSIY